MSLGWCRYHDHQRFGQVGKLGYGAEIYGGQLVFSLGSLLVEAKESLLKGSILTALILLGTYLYLRSEFNKLKDI